MTAGSSKDFKEVAFVNRAAQAAYMSLPQAAWDLANASLVALQNGAVLPPGRIDSLSGANLKGVDEIRIPYDGDTYRVYHVSVYREVIYILDAGMKKSPRKGEIPREQLDRLEKRLKQADAAYAADQNALRKRFAAREAARDAPETTRKVGPR